MITIPRMSDRYKLKVGKVTFLIAPLTYDHKTEISNCTKTVGGQQVIDLLASQKLLLKYGLKDVDGVYYTDKEKFKLSFDGEYLSDDTINELMNIPQKKELVDVSWQILNGKPDDLVDFNGEKLKGVKLEIVEGKQLGSKE